MSQLTKMFISSLVQGQNVGQLLDLGKVDHLFKEYEQPMFDFLMNHAKQYGKFPSYETVKAHTKEDLPKVTEPAKYYRDLLQEKWVQEVIKTAMTDAQKAMVNNPTSASEAMNLLGSAVMQVQFQKNSNKLVDFTKSAGTLIPAYVALQHAESGMGTQFGWPTLDAMSGGIGKGDLISFVGRPAMGKTWFLLWAALHAHQKQKKKVLFISMEMAIMPIQLRLAAMIFNMPYTKYLKGQLSSKLWEKFKAGITALGHFDVPFYVVDGNLSATVEDAWSLVTALQPDSVYIDGGYLMQHPKERDRFKRVAENCNLMKMTLSPLAPTTVSWQFSRSAAPGKKKKGEKPGLEDIGYTDSIGQDSSLVAGISQPESLETYQQREVDILKGRNGEQGKFLTYWDFLKMDFNEIEAVPIDQLNFS